MIEEIRIGIGERLRQERDRLSLTQAAFAELADVSKRSVASWESGESTVGADALARLVLGGLDVHYVLTGTRTEIAATALSADERRLLERYRSSSPILLAYLQEFDIPPSSVPADGKAGALPPMVMIGGDVGQSVAGDSIHHEPVTFKVGKKR